MMPRKPLKFDRRHYELIAKILKDSKPVPMLANYEDQLSQWEYTVEEFKTFFEKANPLFDKIRFTMACGIPVSLEEIEEELEKNDKSN